MSEIKNGKILITGGAGFIGSNLAEALVKDNEVVVVDDLSMGNLQNLPKSSNLHFFKHSITDYKFMEKLLLEWNFNYIYLLAAVASVADTIKRPSYTHEVNQNANLNILEIVRINNLHVKKILFASSAAVYGNNPDLPKAELSMIDPLTPYAIDKYATERFVIDYGRLYGIPTVATRFFNVYGPKQNPSSPYSGVLSLISKSIRENSIFTLFGSGNQTRDFIYIDDVVAALLILTKHKTALHSVYNVATGTENSLNTVISIFEKIVGKKIRIIKRKARLGDITDSYANIRKIQAEGFSSKYSIEDGLKKYWDSLN